MTHSMRSASLLLVLAAAAAGARADLSDMPVWPYPKAASLGSGSVAVAPSLAFVCDSPACASSDVLSRAFARYVSTIFVAGPPGAPQGAAVANVTVSVQGVEELQLGMNESYELRVGADGSARISSASQWGALRALETFAQLVTWQRGAPATYAVSRVPVLIQDAPRFPWRGVLLDSSRHFQTVSIMKKTLDAMSYNKYNTLHWHIVDDQAWPLHSDKFPNFAKAGAYDPSAVYSKQDVVEIVQYARDRGIRVMPEFDMPGHAAIWGKGYPELMISCPEGEALLDPTGPLYDTLAALLQEFSTVFPDKWVHLGGDEVYSYACWNSSAKVQAYMAAHGLVTMRDLRAHFQQRVRDVVAAAGKQTIFWEEVFNEGAMPTQATLNVWLSLDKVAQVLSNGIPVVNSAGWYLDQQTPPGGTHYLWEDTWMNFYAVEPLANSSLTPAQQALFLGGEASQWGEQVDATNIQGRMWPRACAAAERLWSPANINDLKAAAPRLEHQRCKMVQRGIAAGPIRPSENYGFCVLPPGSPFA